MYMFILTNNRKNTQREKEFYYFLTYKILPPKFLIFMNNTDVVTPTKESNSQVKCF